MKGTAIAHEVVAHIVKYPDEWGVATDGWSDHPRGLESRTGLTLLFLYGSRWHCSAWSQAPRLIYSDTDGKDGYADIKLSRRQLAVLREVVYRKRLRDTVEKRYTFANRVCDGLFGGAL